MSLKERTFELLKGAHDQRFTARQIAIWIHERYPDETTRKLENSSALRDEAGLLQQLVAEIGANRPQ